MHFRDFGLDETKGHQRVAIILAVAPFSDDARRAQDEGYPVKDQRGPVAWTAGCGKGK